MPNVVRGFVSDDRALVCKSTFTIWLCTDRRDLKQTSVRVGTKLLGRNINLENVGRVLKIGASDRRKTDGREFVLDSLMNSFILEKKTLPPFLLGIEPGTFRSFKDSTFDATLNFCVRCTHCGDKVHKSKSCDQEISHATVLMIPSILWFMFS